MPQACAGGGLTKVLPDWDPVGFFGPRLHVLQPWVPRVPRAVQRVQRVIDHLRETLRQGFART